MFSSTVGATRKYTCQGYAPLYLFSTIIYKRVGANAPYFLSSVNCDMFVENNENNISSTIGATRKYSCQGYAPLTLF
jgi:hypothetical protein